jgi:hypothetical protein
MKRLALCALVVCMLALPVISVAQSVGPVPVLPNLSGHWNVQLAGVDQSGNVTTTTTAVIMTLTQVPKNPAFYYGTFTGGTEGTSITLVQEGADVRFTISSGSKTTIWGEGLAGKNLIDLQWRDAAGVTGIGKAVKQ